MTAGVPGVTVRRVTPDDGPVLRELRLEALRDTPTAYLELLEDAERHPDEVWQARARRGAVGGDSVQLLALGPDGRAVGTVVGFSADGTGWLAAVYLTPSVRGAGLLARLVAQVEDWHREQGSREVRLEVREDNVRAQVAYARLGYAFTGERQPYEPDPAWDELMMAKAL